MRRLTGAVLFAVSRYVSFENPFFAKKRFGLYREQGQAEVQQEPAEQRRNKAPDRRFFLYEPVEQKPGEMKNAEHGHDTDHDADRPIRQPEHGQGRGKAIGEEAEEKHTRRKDQRQHGGRAAHGAQHRPGRAAGFEQRKRRKKGKGEQQRRHHRQRDHLVIRQIRQTCQRVLPEPYRAAGKDEQNRKSISFHRFHFAASFQNRLRRFTRSQTIGSPLRATRVRERGGTSV